MKRALVCAAVLLLFMACGAAAFQMRSGYYVGTGAAHNITGLGITPDLVIIKADTSAGEPVFRTSVMTEGTAYFASPTANFTNGITALNSDGFTVDIDPKVNGANVRYTWVAFSGSGGGDFKVGSYTGNSVDNRSITGIGFQPDLVFIKGSNTLAGYNGCWRPSSYIGDSTQFFHAAAPAANLIQNLEADGFQVGTGTNVNTLNVVYFYVAFKNVSQSMKVGTYDGTTPEADVTGLGFQPDFMWTKGSNTTAVQVAVMRSNQNYGDESGLFSATLNFINGIKSFISNGFHVGTDVRVNEYNKTYYYAAFKGVPAITPSGIFKMKSDSYDGNGNPTQQITGLGFKPDLLLIKSGSGGGAYDYAFFTTSDMPSNYSAYFASNTANLQNAILSLNDSGFTVHQNLNISPKYYWTAFSNSGSSNFKVGAYTGTGGNNRSISGLGFTPDLVVIKSNAANYCVGKTSSMDANNSFYFFASAEASGRILSLDSDGFSVGTAGEVNASNTLYYYYAFKTTPGQFMVSNYDGNNTDNTVISGEGFRPGMVWIKQTGAVAGVHKAANLSGDLTQYFSNTTNLVNGIHSLEADGFQIGTHATINSLGSNYRFAAWKLTSTQLQATGQPTNTAAGSIIPPVSFVIQDQYGNTDTSDNSTQVTIAISANPGGGTLSGTLTKTASNGVATFSDLSINKKGVGYTLIASSPNLTSSTTNPFNITHASANKLSFTVQPSDSIAGTSISPAVVVEVQDQYGNTVTADNTTEVLIAIQNNPGGGTLSGTLTGTSSAGIATFSNLSINKTGSGYTLTGTASGLASTVSSSFEIDHASANKLAITVQPSNANSGAIISPAIKAVVRDQFDNLASTDNSTQITLSIANNPGGGTVFGTLTKVASSGEAVFNDIYINKKGAAYKLLFSANTLAGATSDAFDISGDMSPPAILSLSPARGANNVLPNAKVVVTYSQVMDKTSAAAAFSMKAISTNGGASLDSIAITGTSSWDATGKIYYFTPNAVMSKGFTYRIDIAASAMNSDLIALGAADSWTFTAVYDRAKSNSFISSDSKVSVLLGPNSMPSDGYVDVNRDPVNHPVAVDPLKISAGTGKLQTGYSPIGSSITEFNYFDSTGTRVATTFAAPITLMMYYSDADNDGIVDGTIFQEKDLVIYRLDEAHGLWVRVPGSTVNAQNNFVYADLQSFSVYTIMATPGSNIVTSYAFPNPFKPSAGHTNITFTNLAAQCTIKIYTISGDLAKTIVENGGSGQSVWDAKNDSGESLQSGLYLYIIKNPTDTKTGKLVIIR